MLEAIKDIGELERSRTGSDLDILVEDLSTNKNYSHMLLITFDVQGSQVTRYAGTDLEEISSARKKQYLYRRGAPNGCDTTPTSLITDPEKTLHTKLDAWIKKNADNAAGLLLSSLAVAYHDAREQIQRDVKALYEGHSGKKGYGLTLLFDDNGARKYVGDYPCFQKCLQQKTAEPGEIRRENHVCSVCGKVQPVVYGDVIPGKTLTMYNLDKPGYIASGFRRENSWKNFPICRDCAMDLEAGTTYMRQHLSFALGGARYYLIPKLIIAQQETLRRVLEEFRSGESKLKQASDDESKKASTQEKIDALRHAERDAERRIIRMMGEQSPRIVFDLLFYDEPQKGVIKILQHVQDVAPGRAQVIQEAMEKTDAMVVFREALPAINKGSRRNIEFSFWQLAQFFKKKDSRTDQTWKQEYLAAVADIFTGKRLGCDALLHQLMQKLRDELLDDEHNQQGKTWSFEEWTRRALNTWIFLQKCQVIPTTYGEVTDMNKSVSDQLFSDNAAVDTPAKKAIFLTGALTQSLLNIQYRDRGSKPFFKELRGLRLKEEDVKGLFPKIINKLEEYDKNYYIELEQEAATQFARAGSNWDLSIDEINFVFALGMTLSNRIHKKEGNDAGNEQN